MADTETEQDPETGSDGEISERQRRFIDEFMVDGNATAAARRAGYAPESAHVAAHRLLRNDKVFGAIKAGREQAADRVEISADRIKQRFAAIAFDPSLELRYQLEALDKLAKIQGLYEKKRDSDEEPNVTITINRHVKAGE